MSAKDTLENMARNTWLAGLGSINSSKEALAKSIEAAQEKSNELYSELLSRGEEIHNKISDKKDEIQAKGQKLFGKDSHDSQEEQIAKLNAAVDDLTSIVVKLIDQRSAEASSSAKTALKAAPKSSTKASSKMAPKAQAKTATSIEDVKAKPKAAAKPKAKTAAKPKPAAKPKATTTKSTAITKKVTQAEVKATPTKDS